MLGVLRSSAERVRFILRRLPEGSLQRDQLRLVQAAIHGEMAVLWRSLGDQVAAGRAEAAAAAVETMHPPDLLRQVMSKTDRDYLLTSARAQAARGVETVTARRLQSRMPLSERVWRARDLTDGTIDNLIDGALVRGASAAELARDVRDFVRPDTRGGIRYAAMRLGRTEINNAFHAQQIQSAIDTPWVLMVRWNLSGSHPEPDECNTYAESQHFKGGEPGRWLPGDVPGKPHPQCLCYMTPETPDEREFVRRYQSGEYNKYFTEEYGLAPPSPVARASADELRADFARQVQLSPDQVEAIDNFQGSTFRRLNRGLREGTELDPRSAVVDKHLSDVMSRYRSPAETSVRRVVDYQSDFLPTSNLSGGQLIDEGYMSTTGRADVSGWIRQRDGAVFDITVPKGKHMLPVDKAFGEDEVLLPKRTTLQITGDEMRTVKGKEVRWITAIVS